MRFWRNSKSKPIRLSNRVLARLSSSLEQEYRFVLDKLSQCAGQPDEVVSMQSAILMLSELLRDTEALRQKVGANPVDSVHTALTDMSRMATDRLSDMPASCHESRLVVSSVLNHLIRAEDEIGRMLSAVTQTHEQDPEPAAVLLPSDLLFQSYYTLFPAERMIVFSGRKDKEGVILGAAFDVTGENSAGHVRADPHKLAQALIAMDATDTHLAAWAHSHPGSGVVGTHPSSIDIKQHHDWLTDYSPSLLSIIFVKDRTLRFWGRALEEGTIHLKLTGTGIHKETDDDHVYKLHLG